MLFKRLTPDDYRDTVFDYTAEELARRGFRAVLLDIDNTLVTYDDPKPTEPVLAWLSDLEAHRIGVAFLSNNCRERVETFNEDLRYFATWDSKKPSGKCYRAAMARLGTGVSDTAVIGDQIFTDVWSAKRLGLTAFLVKPIKDKTTLFFRFKRALEKPVLRRYTRLKQKRERAENK